jgi:hypothetical protein
MILVVHPVQCFFPAHALPQVVFGSRAQCRHRKFVAYGQTRGAARAKCLEQQLPPTRARQHRLSTHTASARNAAKLACGNSQNLPTKHASYSISQDRLGKWKLHADLPESLRRTVLRSAEEALRQARALGPVDVRDQLMLGQIHNLGFNPASFSRWTPQTLKLLHVLKKGLLLADVTGGLVKPTDGHWAMRSSTFASVKFLHFFLVAPNIGKGD